jgi:hypothetical protein
LFFPVSFISASCHYNEAHSTTADKAVHQSGELEKLLVKEGLIPELPELPADQK